MGSFLLSRPRKVTFKEKSPSPSWIRIEPQLPAVPCTCSFFHLCQCSFLHLNALLPPHVLHVLIPNYEISGHPWRPSPKATTSIKLSQIHPAQRDCSFLCSHWTFSLSLSSNPSYSHLNYGHRSVHLGSHEVKLLKDNSWTLSIFASLSTQKRICLIKAWCIKLKRIELEHLRSILFWKHSSTCYYLLETGRFLCIYRHQLEESEVIQMSVVL